MYFVQVTIFTIGYGDITPQSLLEKTFTIVLIYVSCIITAVCINQIGSIIGSINEVSERNKKEQLAVSLFMNQNSIN
jgi:potassium voltage-gated channel Eag-related subfamily H protein 5